MKLWPSADDDKLSFCYVYNGGKVKNKEITKVSIQEGLVKIDDYAFAYCEKLESVIFSGLKEIGYRVTYFHGLPKLERVIIPRVTEIGDGAFAFCSSLRSIEMPDSLTAIGKEAFRECESLAEVIIPKNVVKIGGNAFYGCTQVEKVVIPKGLTYIGHTDFRGCFSRLHDQFEESVYGQFHDQHCLKILEDQPLSIRTSNMKGNLPLHFAVKTGRAMLVEKLLKSYPEGATVSNNDGELPLHVGLRALGAKWEIGIREFEAIRLVLKIYPDAARIENNDGYTPLFLMCMSVNLTQGANQEYFPLLKEIFDAFPEAATISCRGAFPINILLEKVATTAQLESQRIFLDSSHDRNLKLVLTQARDGRSLRPLCSLKDRVSLLVFLLIFDERERNESPPTWVEYDESLHSPVPYKPRLDLNKQVFPGWSLLEIIADFDTVDSADILLRIIKKQRDKLHQNESTFSIQYTPKISYYDEPKRKKEMSIEFISVQAVQESVLVRVADRAKLCTGSPELRKWGQTYGRMLGRYRVLDDKPKHVSDSCRVVFGTEAREDPNGSISESPVALKFMTDKAAFIRELEKRTFTLPNSERTTTLPEFVLPVKAFFVSEERFEITCDEKVGQHFGVDLQQELLQFPYLKPGKDGGSAPDIYLLVMECGGGTDLHDVIAHQNIAGKDLYSVISIAKEIARCLQYLNETCGIIHGDVKARNFVSRGVGQVGLAAIDLDNAASIRDGEVAGGKRTSSGYLPPEQAAVEAYRRFGSATSGSSETIESIEKEIKIAMENKNWSGLADLSQQRKDISETQQGSGAPEDVAASAKYDMWCFGALLYYLCSGAHLFNVDVREELTEDGDILHLVHWGSVLKQAKLSKISKLGPEWPVDLLDRLLKKDPNDRPESWQWVIDKLGRCGPTENVLSEKMDRLVVFQSDPLVAYEKTQIPRIDFESEVNMLKSALGDAKIIGSKIEVMVDAATMDSLSAFFAQKLSRVLHFSGHGDKDFFAMENGFGGVHKVSCDDLKRYVETGGGFLKLVVVTACHSQNIGKAFIDAGVPHAICSQLEDPLYDLAARVFSSSFYRALACGNTLLHAYRMAQHEVRVNPRIRESPQIQDPDKEAEKFLLLSKDGEDPDVQIFFTDEVRACKRKELPQRNSIPQKPPVYFCGREKLMYNIIGTFHKNHLVVVHGSEFEDTGVGKTCVVAAACRYMVEKRRALPIDFFYWLDPSHKPAYDGGDRVVMELYNIYYNCVLVFKGEGIEKNDKYRGSMQELETLLMEDGTKFSRTGEPEKRHVLLVIDERKPGIQDYERNLKRFIFEMLLIETHVVKIILISSFPPNVYTKDESLNKRGILVESILVQPLYFPDALKLLRVRLPDDLKEFFPESKVSELKETLHPHVQEHAAAIWGRYLGCGIPRNIIEKAREMREEDINFLMNFQYNPLNFERTVKLLWDNLDRSIKKRPNCATFQKLFECLEPTPKMTQTNQYNELLERLGNGIPHKVVQAAKGMTEGDMNTLEEWWPLQCRKKQPGLFL